MEQGYSNAKNKGGQKVDQETNITTDTQDDSSRPAVPPEVFYNAFDGTVKNWETWETIVAFDGEGHNHNHKRIVALTEMPPYADDIQFWRSSAIVLADVIDALISGIGIDTVRLPEFDGRSHNLSGGSAETSP